MSQTNTFPATLRAEIDPLRPADRRRKLRFPCDQETRCLLTLDDFTGLWALRVQNLSTGGAKLLLNREVVSDRIRTIGFFNQARGYCCERRVLKVYHFRCPDGVHVLGIAFASDLSAEDLRQLT